MRTSSIWIIALSLLTALALAFSPLIQREYTVITDATTLGWVAKKLVGGHTGTVKLRSGEFLVENGELTAGSFVADMGTITVTDLEGDSKQKLEGHLNSADFFATQEYGTATFELTSARKTGDRSFEASGNLTIKGKTLPISFPVEIITSGDQARAIGTMVVDRTKYDIRYGSASFFDNLGDSAIDDTFEVSFEIVAR